MGSLRHYFATQPELAFAMRLVIERTNARIEALDLTGDPRADAQRVVEEILPLDVDRRVGAEIWFAFVSQSQVDPELEAVRLYALTDGLAVHAVLQPDRVPPELMRAIACAHLDELCAAPSA